MLIDWIRCLKGYVVIKVSGYAPERFLNLCCSHGILVWDIERQAGSYRMKMTVSGFRRTRPLARKTKTKIMILEKHGLPFFIFKSRKRKAFFLGIVLCTITLYWMSLFIWDIRITGCEQYTPDLILDFLKENGISHGMKKSAVNSEEIQFLIRDQYERITWTSVSIQGTRLLIQIKENTSIPSEERVEETEAKDLIAPADGKIVYMIVRKGTPLKEIGDMTEKGEVLVSGRIDIRNDAKEIQKYEYCAADADILIEYEQVFYIEQCRTYKKRVYTGMEKRGILAGIADKKIYLYPDMKNTVFYDVTSFWHQLRLLDNFYLPIYWGHIRCREYEWVDEIYTEEETKTLLNKALEKEFGEFEKKGLQIIENNVKIQIEENRGAVSGCLVIREKAEEKIPAVILPDPYLPDKAED